MAASVLEPAIQAIRPSFLKRLFQVVMLLAAFSAAISIGGKFVGRAVVLAGHTEETTRYEVTVGDDVLTTPANAIRFSNARRGGRADRLELYLRWPSMEGYTGATRDDFNNVGGSRDILFLSFEPRAMSRDMSGRYDPIYRFLIEPKGRAGPAGIVFHDFATSSGYVNETLAVSQPNHGERLVARCLIGPSAADLLAPCERDIQIGKSLSLTYRFPEKLLADWPALEKAVRAAAAVMLRPGS